MACKDLENLIQDLSVDIESSRKRKRLMAKDAMVLKKDTLAKYEMRLQNAVQLSTFALQGYTTYVFLDSYLVPSANLAHDAGP
ncbi:hypothetical protein B0T20DRAFT_417303 [Sordaria brevicollis]|uniref:Uncharacterized protein n=1 Tax=Sordaria brevicollis TaxID=83679 RepID=A0AAE0PAN0_SORBR|nr:hypothetical protein B0T20DRAFT_417303 [Sordaria brevicollis]